MNLKEVHEVFEAGKYKEAGEQFEVLLKDEKFAENPVINMNLAYCYQE